MATPILRSCDTFVCLPPNTLNNVVIFGKNSDRPQNEVQEIIHLPQMVQTKNSKQRCTYIEIDQVDLTYEVVLSKPSWMWGAEMGANQFGVCIGNEAVWTKLNDSREDIKEKLLGMDLVRLGLERSKSAREAVDVITMLLKKYGQGGPCSDSIKNWAYHNSFLIADKKEAWVLETAGNFWAAERVTSGWRNISNSLSIGVKIDLMSEGLQGEAFKLGFWDGQEPFHFAKVFSDDYDPEGDGRFREGGILLEKYSKDGKFDVKSMMKILRDRPSGICMGCDGSFVSTSSQVSVLACESISESDQSSSCQDAKLVLDCHWLTGTPDPAYSLFKPFIFPGSDPSFTFSKFVMSFQAEDADNEGTTTRIQTRDKYKHVLYKEHAKCYQILVKQPEIKQTFMELENRSIVQVCALLDKVKDKDDNAFKQLKGFFNDSVSKELEFYRQISNS